MDAVEFVEEILDLDLTYYQKRLLKAMEENSKNNKQVFLNIPRRYGISYTKKLFNEYMKYKSIKNGGG